MSKNGAVKKDSTHLAPEYGPRLADLGMEDRYKRVVDVLDGFSADIAADGKLKASLYSKRQKGV